MSASARLGRTLAVVGAVAVAASCGNGQASDTTARSTPARTADLRFGALYPLTVRGEGFAGREHVRVTLSGSRRASKTVVADRRGRFTVRFDVRVPACGSALVRAVGRAGSRASRELPRPDCAEQ